ncbi:hexose transport-related protein [Phaffia rhodozyma]|uniref:Hexose transport-related protein n=1 Tax=Phaffia rhodozyma TaxID=264483 RepID=A0A0F7SE42_PHARH|nr:hexose transport-related protein [Phaffia rhodozyma]
MGKNFTLTLCFFQSLAGLLFGWEQSVISGLMLMPDFKERFGTCTDNGTCAVASQRQSVITGIFSVGCFIGALISGALAGKIGLRNANLFSLILFMAGIAIETSAQNTYAQLVVGRVLTGYSVGCLSGLVPTFQAEACPPKWRGVVTGSFQGCVTLGIFLANVVNKGMNTYKGATSWRVPIAIQLAFGLLLFIGFVFSPESPTYFAKRGETEKCRAAIARLRGTDLDSAETEEFFQNIQVRQQQEAALGDSTYRECFSPNGRILFRTAIGCIIQIGQQVTGINFFFSYGAQFFQNAGLSDPFLVQIILSAVNLAMTFPGMYVMYAVGRRNVMIWGAVVMFIGQIIVGFIGHFLAGESVAGKVLIAFSCVFIAAFACTWGPVAWVVTGETFPTRLAAKCVTIATASNWGMNTIIAFVVPIVTQEDGANLGPMICWVWAGFILAIGVFTFFFVPETKGLSIESIDDLYHARIPAWKSASWNAQRRAEQDAGAHDESVHAHKLKNMVDQPVKIDHKHLPDSGHATPLHNLSPTNSI